MAISYSPRSTSRNSPSRLSISSTSSSQSGAGKTNTLAVTGLQREFFHDSVLLALREHFEMFGSLVHWVALPSFGRILVIYEYEADAEKAKLVSDPIVLGGSDSRSEVTMRVYRADHTPLDTLNGTTAEGRYLLPPTTDKNFLISPPGSPPVGWEPIREDPPNAAPLADDLIMALKKLQIEQRHRRGGSVDENRRRGSVEVLLEPDDVIGVGVYVENCDEEEDGNDAGEGMLGDGWGGAGVCKPIPTAMPPPGGSGITPTAMPPIRV